MQSVGLLAAPFPGILIKFTELSFSILGTCTRQWSSNSPVNHQVRPCFGTVAGSSSPRCFLHTHPRKTIYRNIYIENTESFTKFASRPCPATILIFCVLFQFQRMHCWGEHAVYCFFVLPVLLLSESPSEIQSSGWTPWSSFHTLWNETWKGSVMCRSLAAKLLQRGVCPSFQPGSVSFLTSSCFLALLGPMGKKQTGHLRHKEAKRMYC